MKNEFLENLAKLCEVHRAGFGYTTDDDGVHISINLGGSDEEEVFVGFLERPDAPSVLRSAKEKNDE